MLTLLVGTYTDTDSRGIYTFKFDQVTAESIPLAVTEIPNPSFLATTPDNRKVYAVTEQQVDAAVTSFDFDSSKGTLVMRSRQLTCGRGTCHVTWIGKEVVAANYSSGSMTVFPLDSEGNLKEGTLFEFFGSSLDPTRQSGSHIHSSQVSPEGKFLFVIDLGGDCIYRYPVDDGKVTDFNPVRIKVPAGQGPRHFAFSRDGRFMYVLTELEGNVLVFDYNGGDLLQIQQAEADPHHARGSADIHFSPDGRFLYASNRLMGDGLTIFRQDPQTGLLSLAGYQPTAVHPRNFTVSPDGQYVFVACRYGNVVQVFRRDGTSGLLEDTGKDIRIPHPVCVLAVPSGRNASGKAGNQ